MDRSVSVIEVGESLLLFDHWVDYLRTDSSLDLRRRAPNDVQSDISIRGSSFGETLVLLNGFRMDDAQSGHHDMDLPLPTESLERIEILRGAGSTLYGSDAIGGAVNFITAHPSHSELRLSAGVGNFGINQQGGSVSLLGRNWDQQLSLERDFSSGFMSDRDYRSLTVFSDTRVKTRWGTSSLMLAYADKPYGANQFYGDFNSWERTKSWFAGWKQDLGLSTEFDLGYRRHTDVFILFRDRPELYENNHTTESWQTALRRKTSPHPNVTVSYGGEGDVDRISSTNLGDHARSRGAGYANLDFRALRRFSLALGAREEIFDSGQSEFSPTLAGGYWLKPGLRVKASVSRGFRLPTYTDLFYHDPANAGNPNLKPESAWSYDAGLQWEAGKRIHIETAVFQNRQQNVIDYVKYFAGDINHATNFQQLAFTGVETSLRIDVSDSQRLDLSYTGIHGTQEALKSLFSSQYVFNYPINNAMAEWQGRLPLKLLAQTRVGVTQRFARNPYAVWDLAFGRRFANLGARLSFSNLADVGYQEVAGIAMPGRSAVLSFEYEIKKH
jgi:iron complex outermembrane receptor protein